MSESIVDIRNRLIASLVAYAASIGITINPNDWVLVPGQLSQTDYKLLLLNAIADGEGYQQQLFDLFQTNQETLISQAAPQSEDWFQFQMLMFQFNATTPQIPSIAPYSSPNPLSVVWNPVVPSYRVISFCTAIFGGSGKCLIKIAAISGGIPVDIESAYPGSLAAATSFVNLIAAPGISYIVTSGKSDWLFLQVDVFYNGVFSAIIFSSVQTAITTFLNNLSSASFAINSNSVLFLSKLEEAILAVAGVEDLDFINVAARPDVAYPGSTTTTWGTASQEYLVKDGSVWNTSTGWSGGSGDGTEQQRSYSTQAGYIALENGTSTGGAITFSQLNQFRVGSSGVLNLNCIPA